MRTALAPLAAPLPASRAQPRRGTDAATGLARLGDRLLDFGVLAFAAWTVAYHFCLGLRLEARWALIGAGAALVPCALVAARSPAVAAAAAVALPHRPRSGSPGRTVLAVTVAAGLGAAVLFAFSEAPWPVTWSLWLVAAGGAVLWTSARRVTAAPPSAPGAIAAAAWALALAALSLFVVRPDADDAYYLRQATWTAKSGRFPLRDTLYSDEGFPALFFPPVPSYEGLLGALARFAPLTAPDLAYLAVTPVISGLAVLALWRLLRTWRVHMIGLALSVAMVFLLTTVQAPEMVDPHQGNHLPGNFFIARAWQGKVILVAVGVPVLLALLHGYAVRPTRRGLVLLAGSGAAAVGLSTTGIFLVPVIAAGCLAPMALRLPWRATAGLAAAAAYPAAAAAVSLRTAGRTPVEWPRSVVNAEELLPPALGGGVIALVIVGAALLAPLLLTRRAGRTIAATVLLAGCLFGPGVPTLIFDFTGLGKPLWRLTWAIPAAALVGVLATQPLARHRSRLVRLAPAAAVCGALAVAGTPLWDGAHTRLVDRPAWKRAPRQVAFAHRLLAHARPGDLVLAPKQHSQTLLIASASVTTVAPRRFYTRALRRERGAYVRERLRLHRFSLYGLGPGQPAMKVRRALRALDVDIACVVQTHETAQRLLVSEGYAFLLAAGRLWCARQSPRTTVR